MGIQQICNTIRDYFKNVREPFPSISKILLLCSLAKRPGLSAIQSTANIVKDLNKLGIPTGPMPDGSPNLTVAHAFASTKEIFRALKKDASIQGSIVPGSPKVAVGDRVGTIVNCPDVKSLIS